MRLRHRLLVILVAFGVPAAATGQGCDGDGVQLQVLGSGTGDLRNGRSASSYIVWLDRKARILIDLGTGSVVRFYQAGAKAGDVDAVLMTQLRVDHSGDLPAFVRSAIASDRRRSLPILGPEGNRQMPSTVAFVRALFDGKRGAFRDLSETVSPLGTSTFKLAPRDISSSGVPQSRPRREAAQENLSYQFRNSRFAAASAPVSFRAVPGLAWRVDIGGKIIVVTGDLASESPGLDALARNADLLVAHLGIPESAPATTRRNEISPSGIGRIAYRTESRQLLLSHRGPATFGRETESVDAIKSKYSGLIRFANDLDCIAP